MENDYLFVILLSKLHKFKPNKIKFDIKMQIKKKNSNITHINFFSKTLNPQRSQSFRLGQQDEMIFKMASQIKNKLTSRTYKNNKNNQHSLLKD